MDFEESYKLDLQVLSVFSCSITISLNFDITPFRSIHLKRKENVKWNTWLKSSGINVRIRFLQNDLVLKSLKVVGSFPVKYWSIV